MASSSSSEYMIYDLKNLSSSDMLSILFYPKEFQNYKFVTSNLSDNTFKTFYFRLMMVVTWIIQKLLSRLGSNLKSVGDKVEYTLNLFSLNGGIRGFFLNYIKGSLEFPIRETANFRSIISHTDERVDLYNASSFLGFQPESVTLDRIGKINPLYLCAIAAKLAYENKAYVNNAVTNKWKMHFVEFYDFFNETIQDRETQAFIFCDRLKDAKLIVVAFRGTEPFNPKDWFTDFDLSFISMGEMGRVHLGFMQALGMQDKMDYKKGWPKNFTGDRKLAYYTLRDKLRKLLEHNKNAKILVTGHSLGGALAILFPSILVLHKEDTILNNLMGVYTFGQPRVGDERFGKYMEARLNKSYKRYYRVVYRYDIVPRVPFEEPIINFSHFGGCIYYKSWYKVEVLKEEPNDNFFNLLYLPSMYFNALCDFFRALIIEITEGKEFKESGSSLLLRLLGLLLPGVASHSPRDYVNSARLGKIVTVKDVKID